MLFSAIVVLMIVLITAYWAYQGFFSSAIMLFESVVAAMLAFAFFEPLHDVWAQSIPLGVGLPLAFMLIFLVSLVVMRVATDTLIPSGVLFELYVERAGGTLCGFFIGMILVGSALVAIQMLPIGSGVLGFERLEDDREGLPVQNHLALKPDAFVVGMANMLSNGRFGGDRSLAEAKPDLLLDLYAARAAPQTEARFHVPEDCLRLMAYWETRNIDHVSQEVARGALVREFSTHEAGVTLADRRPAKFLVCQVRLLASAGKEDRRGEIRFRVPQFRLVGPRPSAASRTAKPHVYPACGMSDIYTHKEHQWDEIQEDQNARLVRFSPMTDMILSLRNSRAVARVTTAGRSEAVEYYEFDVAFEVPDDSAFVPWYIEFKRGTRIELNEKRHKIEPPARARAALVSGGALSSAQGASSSRSGGGRPRVGAPGPGRVHVANAIEERTGVFDELPMVLDASNPVVQRCLRGGKFERGHISIPMKDEEVQAGSEVTQFLVPSGKRIVQIGADPQRAESMFGRALSYAASVAAQIKIHTSDGDVYFAQGVYASAPVGGEMFFEIQYWPDTPMPERCLQKSDKVTRSVLQNTDPSERKLGFIFLVDPGVKITGFYPGRRDQTAQGLNIDVPD